MTVVDRLITWIFPGWGARRLEARLIARTYDSATSDRDRARLRRPDPGPVTENRKYRSRLLDEARDLDRNNAFAHGVFNAIVDNVVGSGIALEARVRSTRGEFRQSANEAAEALWREWAEGVDSTGKMPFWQLQRLVERELWVANEVLIVRSEAVDGRRVPLALELVESERLAAEDNEFRDFPNVSSGNKVVQGVEFTPGGTISAYHIYDAHPNDGLSEAKLQRIPASRVLHLFHPRRPGEVRGTSRTASVAKSFQALAQYLDFELTKARISAAWATVITRRRGRSGFALPSTGDANDATDSALNDLGFVAPGMLYVGQEGDDIKSAGPSITSTAFDPFVTLILRMISSGLNVSYEIMTRDFSKHNFASMRQSFLEDRRHWEPRQSFLIAHLCNPVWTWFAGLAGLSAIQPFVSLSPAQLRQVDWIPAGWDWVDPLKEKQADALGAKVGFQDVKKLAARHGQDLEKNLENLGDLRRMYEAQGLKLPKEIFQEGQASTNGNSTETEAPEDESEEAQAEGRLVKSL